MKAHIMFYFTGVFLTISLLDINPDLTVIWKFGNIRMSKDNTVMQKEYANER